MGSTDNPLFCFWGYSGEGNKTNGTPFMVVGGKSIHLDTGDFKIAPLPTALIDKEGSTMDGGLPVMIRTALHPYPSFLFY